MKVWDVKQGSPEWLRLRLGIPTASNFHRIYTPGGKPVDGEARRRYMNELLAERALGEAVNPITTAGMEHGREHEPQAVAGYEFKHDVVTTVVGFVTNDAGTIGASPDRFVGEDGLMEVKSPANPAIHVGYLNAARGKVAATSLGREYRPQVQGQLWIITGRQWVDTVSFHPRLPEALIRLPRDEEYIAGLSEAVTLFSADLEREWSELAEEFGLRNLARLEPEQSRDDYLDQVLGVSQADIEAIMAGHRYEEARA